MVLLSYGGGGYEMDDFLKNFILKNLFLEQENGLSNDAAIEDGFKNIAFSTDSFVLNPIFINGANIGKIAACGSINDVLMMGAMPKYISLALILEEGFSKEKLKIILNSFANELKEANVKLKCGDLKVLPKGKCDEIFINTTCIGDANTFSNTINPKEIKSKDKIILSADIARHGACVMASRNNFQSNITSDAKCLINEVSEILKIGGIRCLRDATRGGIASVLNELSQACNLEFLIQEEEIIVSDEVFAFCELLGFSPYDLANEGTFICIASANKAEDICVKLQEFNPNARIIGEVQKEKGAVILQSPYGLKSILQSPKGELLPRIC